MSKITVEIEFFEHKIEKKYFAEIIKGDYKGTMVEGDNIADCFYELSSRMRWQDFLKKENETTIY